MIAIVYPQFYGVGGIARYLDSFLGNLPVDHPPIHLITGDEHQQPRHYPGVEIVHIPMRPGRLGLVRWSLQTRKLLMHWHRQQRISLVNLHIPPLIPGLFLPHDIPIVLTAHTTYLGMSGRFYATRYFDSQWSRLSLAVKSWMEHRILARTSKVITLSEQGRQEILAYHFKGQIHCIPNGADTRLFTPDPSVPQDIDLLFCGRIERRKGSHSMAELCRRLVQARPDIRIAIVGYGEDENWLKSQLAGFSQQIRFTGKIPFAETIGYYRRSRVYASTSYYEGLPGTCLEAMSAALPVVVWDFLFYRDLVMAGQTGLLAAPDDFDRMTQNIFQLLDNPHMAADMGKNGRQHLESGYNWKKLAQDILVTFQP